MPPQRGGARTRRPAGLLRSEEHTSELQSPCNLVCRIIISKEHTSELQSPCNLVCRLLLEKKKKYFRHVHCVIFFRPHFLQSHSPEISSSISALTLCYSYR